MGWDLCLCVFCRSLVLRDIECSHCHRVCDMDLTTDEWACPAEECHADYEPEYIESRLVQEIEERVQHFQAHTHTHTQREREGEMHRQVVIGAL